MSEYEVTKRNRIRQIRDYAEYDRESTARVHDLLRALAWGEGKGLTRRVWAPVASALAREGSIYDDNDTTVFLSGNIYEDVLAAQLYRGRGMERRNRLT